MPLSTRHLPGHQHPQHVPDQAPGPGCGAPGAEGAMGSGLLPMPGTRKASRPEDVDFQDQFGDTI